MIAASSGYTIVGVLVVLLVALASCAGPAGDFTSETYDGRTYKIYVPEGHAPEREAPLVVMLHGCTQDPDDFAAGTRMNEIAEREDFIVLYPQQDSTHNLNKCWNWFDPEHQSRGSGEPALISGMARDVERAYSIDDDRVYAAGLSAGGAMAVILGAAYPDIFAAINVGAGLEYKAATSAGGAFGAMDLGGPEPERQGDAAYVAMGRYARTVPTIVFHGTSDDTVSQVNARQVISQWAQTNDRASDGSDDDNIDDTPEKTVEDSVSGGRAYTRYVYEDNTTGSVVLEKYLIDGMGHAWSGGSTEGSYTDPRGPSASDIGWRFFSDHPKSDAAAGDTQRMNRLAKTGAPTGGSPAAGQSR